MIKYKKVEDDASFVRDMSNKAIINVDNSSLLAYKQKKKAAKALQDDVSMLKSEMQEIKLLLLKILDK